MKRILTALALVALAACSGNSADYVTYFLDKGFDGHPVNEFFHEYGYPFGEFARGSGAHVYRWTSIQPTPRPTASKLTRGYVEAEDMHYRVLDNYDGSIARQYCELRITTDAADNVQGFAIVVDSTGKWGPSRCSELFNRTYP